MTVAIALVSASIGGSFGAVIMAVFAGSKRRKVNSNEPD